MEVPVPSQEDERSCICVVRVLILSLSIGFWNCSKGVVYSVFHFIMYKDQSRTNKMHYLQLPPNEHV